MGDGGYQLYVTVLKSEIIFAEVLEWFSVGCMTVRQAVVKDSRLM